jgi:hypothetical protein
MGGHPVFDRMLYFHTVLIILQVHRACNAKQREQNFKAPH